MQALRITVNDDLDQLVADINNASWDDSNEMCAYNVADLRNYLQQQDTIFIACYDRSTEPPLFLGIASARLEHKPYGGERWLYVDEVDVCTDQRQRGAGKLMMEELLQIARANGCEELWLGTEMDNSSANALYKSLGPDDVLQFIGYTYETDE